MTVRKMLLNTILYFFKVFDLIILNAIMLSPIAPNVMPSVIMLNSIMLSVIMSNVAAPVGVANFIFAFKALSWGHLFPGFEGESFLKKV